MKKLILIIVIALLGVVAFTGVKTYNTLAAAEQNVALAWSQLETQYQRRYDLIPNLVNTVKGQANFESKTLEDLAAARAKATSLQVDAKDLTPETLAKISDNQNQLSQALGRFLSITENYPTLRANEAFLNLQAQLEGVENRVAFARDEYNKIVKEYNLGLISFPKNIVAKLLGFSVKPYVQYAVDNSVAPTVDFSK